MGHPPFLPGTTPFSVFSTLYNLYAWAGGDIHNKKGALSGAQACVLRIVSGKAFGGSGPLSQTDHMLLSTSCVRISSPSACRASAACWP